MMFVMIAGSIVLFLSAAILVGVFGLRRFTAGSTTESALAVAKTYNEKGFLVVMDYAAEAAVTEKDAQEVVAKNKELLGEMRREIIRGDIAVKPSSLVADRWGAGAQNRLYLRLGGLARMAAESKRTLWIDREHASDHAWVLPVEKKLLGTWKEKQLSPKAKKVIFIPRFSNIGLVIQAYRANSLKVADTFLRWHSDGARFRVRVCRGAYPREAELSNSEIAERFLRIYRRFIGGGIPTVAATHTLVNDVISNNAQKPIVHMLHGRKEVERVLTLLVREEQVTEPAVYLIFGPVRARLKYLVRRFWEDPRLILWFWT